jgi:putative tricarboxylic transport membrane protein
MEHLLTAFAHLFTPMPFLMMFVGVAVGVVVGAIPGLSGGMVIALTLPLTFFMESTHALILMVSMYVGSTSGGLISATLMRMPGTPAALMTVLDGFPMAKGGRPGRALGFGIYASFIGGLVSWLFLALLSPPLAEIAVRFGPFEIFSMTLVALFLISAVSSGSMIKGLLSGFLGIIVSMVGVDESSGALRLTFGIHDLETGFRLLPVILGMLVLSQVIGDIIDIEQPIEKVRTSMRSMFMTFADIKKQWVNLLRSSLIGTWIGILPGIGGTTAAIASYTTARNFSRTPEKFGTGTEDGIVAAETANNAAVNGALVPLITLGIPGSVIDVLLLGALIIHNLTPGPLLFRDSPDVVYAIIAAALVANFVMFGLMVVATPLISRLMYVSRAYLIPPIIVFCVIGAFAQGNRLFDIWVMLGFGILGFLMMSARVPTGPFIIGYILAPIAEVQLRSGLMLYDGSFLPLVTRPVSAAFLVVAILTLFWPVLSRRRSPAKKGAP